MTNQATSELIAAVENLGDALRDVCRGLADVLKRQQTIRSAQIQPSATAAGVNPPRLELLTVKQVADEYPAFTEASLRKLIFRGPLNGLECAIRRIGRRVLVDRRKFEAWLELSADQRRPLLDRR